VGFERAAVFPCTPGVGPRQSLHKVAAQDNDGWACKAPPHLEGCIYVYETAAKALLVATQAELVATAMTEIDKIRKSEVAAKAEQRKKSK
jgi:hypothetical protein